MKKAFSLFVIIIMSLSIGTVCFAAEDDDGENLDIKINSVKQREEQRQSELDISKYDFFTAEEKNQYDEHRAKEQFSEEKMKSSLFVGKKNIVKDVDIGYRATELKLFNDNIEYDMGVYNEEHQKNYTIQLIIAGFIALGIISFFSARFYSKMKGRKK